MTFARKATYTTGLFIVFFSFYFFLQHSIDTGNIDLILEIDKSIPFMPEFVWVYHSIFFQVFLVMVCFIKDKKLFFNTFWSCVVCSMFLLFFYTVLPSFYPRVEFEITSLSTQLVDLTRTFDASNNTFPSGHVTFSWLMFLAMSKTRIARIQFGLAPLFLLWALGISLSTLVIKQHFLVDVMAGCTLAFTIFYVIDYFHDYASSSQLLTFR